MVNISVSLKCGGNFVVTCEHFRSSNNFIYFSIDNYDVCCVYAADINDMYTFDFRFENGDFLEYTDLLFSEGKIIKVV